MRALAQLEDPARVERARRRARARRAPTSTRFVFRRPIDSSATRRVETAEARRRRVRDAVLRLGHDPAAWPNAALALEFLPITPSGGGAVRLLGEESCEELDGTGARAARYRSELERGRWRLPDHWPRTGAPHGTPITPEEGAR
jgi:hypothetical protein